MIVYFGIQPLERIGDDNNSLIGDHLAYAAWPCAMQQAVCFSPILRLAALPLATSSACPLIAKTIISAAAE